MSELLSVRGLGVGTRIAGHDVPVIRDLSFDLPPTRILGLVGESGAGKSTVGRAIAQMLPPGFAITAGECLFQGKDLVRMSAGVRRALLGREIACIPQSPQTALDPLQTVGQQFDEHLRRIDGASRATRRQRALAMLEAVHLADPAQVLASYSHQLSGGMCQRVLIAMAFASNPKLVIADEPTTALDVTIQAHILALITEMQRRYQTALIFITHNLALASRICDEIIVMYAGAAVEIGRGRELFKSPAHPYTRCLELADPETAEKDAGLFLLPDRMPSLIDLHRMPGCHFAPRCALVADECRRTPPPLIPVGSDRRVACIRSAATMQITPPAAEIARTMPVAGAPLLCVEGLSKQFVTRDMWFGRREHTAVRDVSFSIAENEFVGLVGESGSGKSTIAKLLVGLEQPTAGRILVHGDEVTDGSAKTRALRIATMQMIFQDAQSALNPRRRLASIITQAMEAGSRHASWQERLQRCTELLSEVGMPPDLALNYPSQLSGGQRQRVNIARALGTRAKLLIADEIVSGLDVSVQAQLLHLLFRLRSEFGFAMLFISHDLSVVRFLCSRVLIMHRGELVEEGATEEVFANPKNPYTKALLAAVPKADVERAERPSAVDALRDSA